MGIFKRRKGRHQPHLTPKCGFTWHNGNGGIDHTHQCKHDYGHKGKHECKLAGCNASRGGRGLRL